MDQIEKALQDLKDGKFVLVTDDLARENEGDLILAAEFSTPEKIALMIRHTSGIICLSMTEERLKELHLPQMVQDNTDPKKTAFTVSVDYRYGVSTGISAADRSKTILSMIRKETTPEDLRRPGHIFPLQYKEGGVLKRAGHTEASVDLVKLAGLYPAAVIAELVNDDGTVSRIQEIQAFAKEHGITIVSVEDIVRFRRQKEKLVTCVSTAKLPTEFGTFDAYVYQSKLDEIEHLALVMGDISKKPALVRVHSECLTGDVFGSKRCDCGEQLDNAMKKISEEGAGVIIYLRGHEGRGIGLGHKLRAYQLQENGCDTVEANLQLGLPVDSREYGIGAQMLSDLGVKYIRLMTNNPSKYSGLTGYDLEIVERVPLQSITTKENRPYLLTKKNKMGHLLEIQ